MGDLRQRRRSQQHQEPQDQESGEVVEDGLVVYFPILSVFDIRQTAPIDPDDEPLTVSEGDSTMPNPTVSPLP